MATPTSSSRRGRRVRAAAGVLAALVVVGGVLVAAVSSTFPIHIRHTVTVPQLREEGSIDKQLVPTGGTEAQAKTDTCVPMRRVFPVGGNHDPAVCQARDGDRLAVARVGLSAAGAGAVVAIGLVAAGLLADRRRRRREEQRIAATPRGLRPQSTPAPR